MDTIDSARSFLDQQNNVAIWYAEYKGQEEFISYANQCFCEAFDLPLEQVIERKKYRLVNPPETKQATIESYKNEDKEAMDKGFFLNRSPLQEHKDILVVKLRFDQGVLGLFKILDANPIADHNTLQDIDPEIRRIVQKINPELLERILHG